MKFTLELIPDVMAIGYAMTNVCRYNDFREGMLPATPLSVGDV
jgi:hypothetical protein